MLFLAAFVLVFLGAFSLGAYAQARKESKYHRRSTGPNELWFIWGSVMVASGFTAGLIAAHPVALVTQLTGGM